MRNHDRIYEIAPVFFSDEFLNKLESVTELDNEQISLIKINEESFTEYWKRNPDLRLPQMIFNMTAYDEIEHYYNYECKRFIKLILDK